MQIHVFISFFLVHLSIPNIAHGSTACGPLFDPPVTQSVLLQMSNAGRTGEVGSSPKYRAVRDIDGTIVNLIDHGSDASSLSPSGVAQILLKKNIQPVALGSFHMSDIALAQKRGLADAVKALAKTNQKLILRLSHDDGSTGYFIGSIEAVFDNAQGKETAAILYGGNRIDPNYPRPIAFVPLREITALIGIPEDTPRIATRFEVSKAQGNPISPELLNRRFFLNPKVHPGYNDSVTILAVWMEKTHILAVFDTSSQSGMTPTGKNRIEGAVVTAASFITGP